MELLHSTAYSLVQVCMCKFWFFPLIVKDSMVYNACIMAHHMDVPRYTWHAESVILVNKEDTEGNPRVSEWVWW